jgi:hypothetical protein
MVNFRFRIPYSVSFRFLFFFPFSGFLIFSTTEKEDKEDKEERTIRRATGQNRERYRPGSSNVKR